MSDGGASGDGDAAPDAQAASAGAPGQDAAAPAGGAASPNRDATANGAPAAAAEASPAFVSRQPYQPTGFDTLLDFAIPALVTLYIWMCPYTKVEESFNMQAIHDLLYHGPFDIKAFDHNEFPGVVPRTFLGAIAVALASLPYKNLVADKLTMQMVVRTVLGIWTSFTLLKLRTAVSKTMGAEVGRWFVVVTAAQFHVLFWASRTLPNIFAFGLVNLALAEWLAARGGHHRMVWLFAAAAAIFRAEVLLFAVPVIAAKWIWEGKIVFRELRLALFHGIAASLLAVALTVAVDSYFWGRTLWPEYEVFKFNGMENKSVRWGVEPSYYYFTNLVPRITGAALPMALGAALVDRRSRFLLLPVLLFLGAYSYLIPHKEWRFVIYVVPLINTAAARWLTLTRTGTVEDIGAPPSGAAPSFIGRLLFLGSLAMLALNALATMFQANVSSYNYPGGAAMAKLHELEADRGSPVYVHIDSFSAMNGITRFLEMRPDWKYSKFEGYQSKMDFYKAGYTHLITSEPQIQPEQVWEYQHAQEAYAGLHPLVEMDDLRAAVAKRDWKKAWNLVWPELVKGAKLAWKKKNPIILLPVDVALDDTVWILRKYRQ
ncbi:Alg9-like mannosyltransferase family-domain-containing protein [Hyaloraphidium curvatum]|nr:Alg9-like mannosyltransferase family-domain-containing protein [Hyaloraphidium curvatum]